MKMSDLKNILEGGPMYPMSPFDNGGPINPPTIPPITPIVPPQNPPKRPPNWQEPDEDEDGDEFIPTPAPEPSPIYPKPRPTDYPQPLPWWDPNIDPESINPIIPILGIGGAAEALRRRQQAIY